MRGSCFVSVPSSEMELTSADFVMLCSLAGCYKIFLAAGVQHCQGKSSTYRSKEEAKILC